MTIKAKWEGVFYRQGTFPPMQTAIRVMFYSKLQILKFFHVPMSFLIDFVIFSLYVKI